MCCAKVAFAQEPPITYEKDIRPLLQDECIKCHNTNISKGGINIDNYKEQARVIQRGSFWLEVLGVIKDRSMPPKTEKPLSPEVYHKLVTGIDAILQASLEKETPGKVVIRRLSHAEYQYTIYDLLGVDFDARSYFPSDGSGGGGFDNQGRALFFTPLKLERYYDAGSQIVDEALADNEKWDQIVPFAFKAGGWQGLKNWVKTLFSDKYDYLNNSDLAAEKVIDQVASRAYRRFLKAEEKTKLLELFQSVYDEKAEIKNPLRFDESIAQVLKAVLVSPNFLYKVEEEPQKEGAYPLSDFEVASRLSYFFWCSTPDQELFDLAYAGKLHDSTTLATQVKRMLADPKSKRFAKDFTVQWLGITKLVDSEPMVDAEMFPGFDMEIRKDLYEEASSYFHHVLTESKNMMDLVNSDYSMLNTSLANYYGIEGVESDDFMKVQFADNRRGGVLGMAGVLATTSISTRTSPVLRGKWVMEQILGISPPPPPPEVSELTEDKGIHEALGLRKILERHRADPECQSCHEKMDPLGLGLENYDPIGKWRESYGKVDIDASGVTAEGEKFNGPEELKKILLTEEKKIARNFSKRILSYAIGRTILFTDETALVKLENTLIENNFNPEPFLIELVNSYPFLKKQSDFEKKSI
ncbi:hypothetical protein DJ013_10300 [Arcticibacterium luteifluviistationis]|uniref:DUF1592 domain-containing protein n=2 Tax=Arcticibacterium luteifluviistationis TaxID=1784714 RepID=A0A2Z4GBU5_9BACT|nr:hypothetical protein DJ013_10300 [Arcticibacterium luteifluviistationis]